MAEVFVPPIEPLKPFSRERLLVEGVLIPFILRDHGRGFAMEAWRHNVSPDIPRVAYDDCQRKPPSCGTIACIGGSMEYLKIAREDLHLSTETCSALFYDWEDNVGCTRWASKYRRAFAKAKTPLGKAKVAVRLLRDHINGKRVFVR